MLLLKDISDINKDNDNNDNNNEDIELAVLDNNGCAINSDNVIDVIDIKDNINTDNVNTDNVNTDNVNTYNVIDIKDIHINPDTDELKKYNFDVSAYTYIITTILIIFGSIAVGLLIFGESVKFIDRDEAGSSVFSMLSLLFSIIAAVCCGGSYVIWLLICIFDFNGNIDYIKNIEPYLIDHEHYYNSHRIIMFLSYIIISKIIKIFNINLKNYYNLHLSFMLILLITVYQSLVCIQFVGLFTLRYILENEHSPIFNYQTFTAGFILVSSFSSVLIFIVGGLYLLIKYINNLDIS
jgi:hypothetical protein